MNSHWFKFYGQDWLTDLKIIKLQPVDRLCFISLLCLASTTDDAIIKKCDEDSLIELTHLYNNPYDNEDNDYVKAKGCLKRFNDNGMITLDNNGDITINNFLKRQGSNLTGYERVKRYRENHKNKPKKNNYVINDNAMITSDKIREDKINNLVPKGTIKNMKEYKEPIIELDNNGDIIQTTSRKSTFGKYPARIAKYYCELLGKTAAGRQLPAAKELMIICQEQFPKDTDEQWFEEIKGRINVAAKYYKIKNIDDWNLSKVAENWDKILTNWNKEVNKFQ